MTLPQLAETFSAEPVRSRPLKKDSFKPWFVCHHYQKQGHKGNKDVSSYVKSSAIVHSDRDVVQILLVVESSGRSKEQWILDSGSSLHITPIKHWFSTYECVQDGVILMGNNVACNAVGIGLVRNVHHISNMKMILISLGVVISSRCKDVLKVTNGFQLVMRGKKGSL